MGLMDIFRKKEIVETYSPSLVFNSSPIIELTEQFKGEVESNQVKFPQALGEEHPFDFSQLEKLYKKFGFFTAVVDKYVDFVVGPGFYVECSDERAKEIIENFMTEVNFDTILRAWCKEALVKGNGFVEIGGTPDKGIEGIKVLSADYMYVVRNKLGEVEGYNQYKGAFDKFAKDKIIPFKPYEIAHVPFNKIGDCAYGLGIGVASLKDVDNLLNMSKDLHWITKRKANSPYHAQLGYINGDTKIIPKPEDVQAMGQKLEQLSNKTEWASDVLTNIKVLDFGNVGDKFATVLEHDMAMLMYDYQIPPELMGMANIPEGMAKVRMDTFERRIQSMQAEFEKVIEQQIFKRILNANGFVKDSEGTEVHVEFQWGRPSNQDKQDRLLRLTELMKNPMISPSLVKLMEKDIVKILDYNENEYEEMTAEEEQAREEERPQPIVPGQNQNKPQLPQPKKEQPQQPKPREKLNEAIKKHTIDKYKFDLNVCKHCEENWDNYNTIEEWLGFKYDKYLAEVLAVLELYDFDLIKAVNETELEAGYLTETQVNGVRKVLENGFKKGLGMREMAKQVDKLGIKDLYRMSEDGKIQKGASGLPILARSAEKRSISIVRSEVTRMANEGAVEYYKKNGIDKVRWIASVGTRTCSDCESLNNQIFEINNHPDIPYHSMCRCTLAPEVSLK